MRAKNSRVNDSFDFGWLFDITMKNPVGHGVNGLDLRTKCLVKVKEIFRN